MNTTSDHSINVLDDNIRRQIAGAIAEVDPAQMAITRKLTSAQRFQQMLSMIDFVENAAARRLRLLQPELSQNRRPGRFSRQCHSHAQRLQSRTISS